jgi:hypothetical protein
MTVRNQYLIQEEIKRRLNSGNACSTSVQNLLSSRLMSKNIKMRTQKIIFLAVVLHGCETWSLTLREQHRLRVFENRELRRIFGPKRVEVTGGWGKLHNEELHNLYSLRSIIRMIKSRVVQWAGYVARMREKRIAYRRFVRKSEGKRQLGRQRRRWVGNIKMVLIGIELVSMDWIDLAQDSDQWRALVNSEISFGFHKMLGIS